MIDFGIIFALSAVFIVAFLALSPEAAVTFVKATEEPGVDQLFSLGVLLAYSTFLLSMRGSTLGMSLLGLKVVPMSGGARLALGQAIARGVASIIPSSCLCGLGYLTIATDKRKQGWHDQIAKTFVVRRSVPNWQVALGILLAVGEASALIWSRTESVKKDRPMTAVAKNNEGVELLNKGKHREALAMFYEAKSLDPSNDLFQSNIDTASNDLAIVLNQQGIQSLEQGSRAEALSKFEEALQYTPNNETIKMNRDYVSRLR